MNEENIMKTNMSRREQLAYMVAIIDIGGKSLVEKAIKFADDHGIEANMHVGESGEFFKNKDKVAEWMMGQFVDGYENNQYLGYNSGINLSMSFLNKDYGYDN